MKLLDLLNESEWNDLSKEMHAQFGISFAISDTNGARVSSFDNWCNALCPRIKSDPQSLSAVCAVAAQHFTAATRKSRQPEIGECDLGLIKIAVPIFVGDTFLGTAGGCGFSTEAEEIETFMIEKLTGMDEADVADLVKDIAPMTQARAWEMADMVTARIDDIVGQYQTR